MHLTCSRCAIPCNNSDCAGFGHTTAIHRRLCCVTYDVSAFDASPFPVIPAIKKGYVGKPQPQMGPWKGSVVCLPRALLEMRCLFVGRGRQNDIPKEFKDWNTTTLPALLSDVEGLMSFLPKQRPLQDSLSRVLCQSGPASTLGRSRLLTSAELEHAAPEGPAGPDGSGQKLFGSRMNRQVSEKSISFREDPASFLEQKRIPKALRALNALLARRAFLEQKRNQPKERSGILRE